ncbi:MAG: elongation factor Ts [Gammaproteobacteria bacterium]|nr:elongation factor Ts [Gammaproteobacteria bacterium]
MSITATMVKELRERTGAGMMECKKALVATSGDVEAAIEAMRKSGQAKADKKAGRVAAEGMIVIEANNDAGVIVEINSETDFVAKDESFGKFAKAVATTAMNSKAEDVTALTTEVIADGITVDAARRELIAKLGENIGVRRMARIEGGDVIASYLHGNRIGVLVALKGGDEVLGRDIAMHVAAANPVCVDAADVPAELLEKEREIKLELARASGKTPEIMEKMVAGQIRKFVNEITLTGQPFVKDPDQSVGKLLKSAGATITAFIRYEVGEGIEKKEENFAEEVMKQVNAADD